MLVECSKRRPGPVSRRWLLLLGTVADAFFGRGGLGGVWIRSVDGGEM